MELALMSTMIMESTRTGRNVRIYTLRLMTIMTATTIIPIANPNILRASVSASIASYVFVPYVLLLSVYVLVDHIHPSQQGKLLLIQSVYKYGS